MSAHLFAEITSRYDLRCIKCGRSSLEERKVRIACPVADDTPGDQLWESRYQRGEAP